MVKCCSKSEAVKLKPAKYLPLSAYSALCVRREDKLGKKIMKETLKGHAFIGTVKKILTLLRWNLARRNDLPPLMLQTDWRNLLEPHPFFFVQKKRQHRDWRKSKWESQTTESKNPDDSLMDESIHQHGSSRSLNRLNESSSNSWTNMRWACIVREKAN